MKKKVSTDIEESSWYLLWKYTRRFLRAFVPQIPAIVAWSGQWFSQQQIPYLVFGGAILTALDKLLRDKGLYGARRR